MMSPTEMPGNSDIGGAIPLVDPDNYIVSGDQVIAIPRSAQGDSFRGRVLTIEGQEPGRREFVLELEGHDWLIDGAIGLPEPLFLFKVQRGDCWISLPLRLLPEEAQKKAERSEVTTRKRIETAVPLFADQIAVDVPSPEAMIARFDASGREQLARDHHSAMRSNDLREQVRQRVSDAQMATLDHSRARMPADGWYGKYFWQKQLAHIEATGHPDIFVPPPAITKRINVPWLKPDAHVHWLTDGKTKLVRVLFIGSNEILIKIQGEPITDYDPRQYPNGNLWVKPEQLAQGPAPSATAQSSD